MDSDTVAQISVMVIAAAGVIVALSGVRRQLWVSIFSQYTLRYSDLMDGLPPRMRDPSSDLNLDDLGEDHRDQVLGVVRKYMNLCSEEMFLAETRYLERKAWRIWQTGIRDTMRLRVFRDGWRIVEPEYSFYPDFQLLMEKYVGEEVPE